MRADTKNLWTMRQMITHYKTEMNYFIDIFKDCARSNAPEEEIETCWDNIDSAECLLELWRTISETKPGKEIERDDRGFMV